MSSRLGFHRWKITFSKPRLSLKVLIGSGLVLLATIGVVYVRFYETFNRERCERCKQINTKTQLARGSLLNHGGLPQSVATRTRFGNEASTNFDEKKTNHSRGLASFSKASLQGQMERSKVAPSPSAPLLRINRFFSSATKIVLPCEEPKAEPVCVGQESRSVELLAETTDPNNVEVSYFYEVTDGKIKGSGAQVTWDLSGVKPGTYKAFVKLSNGSETSKSLTVTVSQCPCTRPTATNANSNANFNNTNANSNANFNNTNANSNANFNVNTNKSTNSDTHINANYNANYNTNANTNPASSGQWPTPDAAFEKNYANQSWPATLPKDWIGEITVDFRRIYDPKDAPTPSNVNGSVYMPTLLPRVLPCGRFSNPKYSASAVVELSGQSDLEVTNPDIPLKSLCGETGDQVSWTIPFRFKNHVSTAAKFKVIFHALLKDNATGKLTVESYELPESTIAVDWVPGTRRQAYLLLGFLFPGGFGMIFLSRLKNGDVIEDSVLHANLWIEDLRHNPIPPPVRLRSGVKYKLLFAIEPRLREMVSSSQVFTEPPELKKALSSDLEIQVVSTLLANESGHENRLVKYYAGLGFDPTAFTLTPDTEGTHFITVRVFFDRTILYRERIHVDVVGAGKAASA